MKQQQLNWVRFAAMFLAFEFAALAIPAGILNWYLPELLSNAPKVYWTIILVMPVLGILIIGGNIVYIYLSMRKTDKNVSS